MMLTCPRHRIQLTAWYDEEKRLPNTYRMRIVCPACEGEKMGRRVLREAFGREPFDRHASTANRD